MNAVIEKPVVEIPTALGAPFAGGFYLGRVFVGIAAFALVVAPKAEGEHDETQWHDSEDEVAGARSYFDGLANTNAMAEAGSELAKWARGLRIAGHDDWHLPSRQDLLVINGNEAAAGAAFQEDGAEAFAREWYWSSTQVRVGSSLRLVPVLPQRLPVLRLEGQQLPRARRPQSSHLVIHPFINSRQGERNG